MKTERAIELLHRISDSQFDGPHGDERREALSMAVRALSGDGDTISRQALCEYALNQKDKCVTPNDIMRFPSAQPETHDKRTETHACDLISRQDAIDAVAKWFYDVVGNKKSDGMATIFERLRELPPAQPQRKKGKWITVNGRLGNEVECDKCHSVFWYWMGNYRFCPNCGARMEGGEGDET